MSALVWKIAAKDDNCRMAETRGVEEGDRKHSKGIEEIYTCLDCLEEGIRLDENNRIIEFLEGDEIWHSENLKADLINFIRKSKNQNSNNCKHEIKSRPGMVGCDGWTCINCNFKIPCSHEGY